MNDRQSSTSSAGEVRTGTIPESAAGLRIDAGLAQAEPELSRERIKALILEGAVTLDGRIANRPSVKLAPGMAYAIALPQAQPLDAERRRSR